MTDKKPPEKPGDESGRTNISIGGNVGPGAVVGPNSHVHATNIAGRDLTSTNEVAETTREDFGTMLGDLRQLIDQARQKGELPEPAAQKAIESIEAATDLASQKSPSKRAILSKLEFVADLLDGATETIDAAGGVAHVLLKAIPVTALLMKLVSYLF